MSDLLDEAAAAGLEAQQSLLQTEALDVVARLDLPSRLGGLGEFDLIGSAASGLMVWPDIDVMVSADRPSSDSVLRAMAPVMAAARVHEVLYQKQTGPRSPTGRVEDERLYFVLRYAAPTGRRWKIDITVWCSDRQRPHVAEARRLATSLTPAQRRAVLWIKSVWSARPEYPYEIGGTDVYTAVLEAGVRTPAEFERYLRASQPTI